jgi:hypothetical protein
MSEDKLIYKEIEDVIFMPKGVRETKQTNGSVAAGWLIIFICWIVLFITYFLSISGSKISSNGGVSTFAFLFMFGVGFVSSYGAYLTLKKENDLFHKISNIIIALIFTFITFLIIMFGTAFYVNS